MFVDSLRNVRRVQLGATKAEPFGGVLELQQRPVFVVVPWGDQQISDDDHELVMELALHTAAAFFRLERASVAS